MKNYLKQLESIKDADQQPETMIRMKQAYLTIIKGLTLEEQIFNWLLVNYELEDVDYTAYISCKCIIGQIEEFADQFGFDKINKSLIEAEAKLTTEDNSESAKTLSKDSNDIGKEQCYFLFLSELKLEKHLWYWFMVNHNLKDIDWYTEMSTHTVVHVCDLHAKEQSFEALDRSLVSDTPENYNNKK